MNNFGRYNPANFSTNNPLNIDTGLGWEYIRIINTSPFLLSVAFGNMGQIDFPENYLEDIQLRQEYNGKIVIIPNAIYSASAIASALSSLITINAYQPGELRQPQAQPLTTLSAVGGGALSTVSQVQQFGQPTPTYVVEATPQAQGDLGIVFPTQINNDGSAVLGSQAIVAPPAHWSTDGLGNTYTKEMLTADTPILIAGQQESGVGGGFLYAGVAGQALGVMVNFKQRMTNVPSGITLTPTSTLNANAPTALSITVDGFLLSWTAPAIGQSRWIGTYTTVGN